MPTLDRAGTHLYYETHGSGPAILLSNGFGATCRMWRPQLDELARDHTVVVWDMRGHGQSDAPAEAGAYSEALAVADIEALLDHLGFDQAVIGGHSLGGYMSLAFTIAHPERVRALLLTDTGPGYKRNDKREEWNVMANGMADSIAEHGAGALARFSAEMRESRHRDARGLAMVARHMLTQSSPHVIEGLSGISAQTLVLVGSKDRQYLGATDYMTSQIPNATKVVIDDAGHAANLDQPAAFNRAVRGFLDTQGL